MTNFEEININNKKISNIQINDKEVALITINDNPVWEKNNRDYIELTFSGKTLTQYTNNTLSGEDIVIDYGDGNVVRYNGDYSHTYESDGEYTIKIYGVTSLEENCFKNCTGLTSVVMPNTVTTLGKYCFRNCTDLTSVVLPTDITTLPSSCFKNCTSLTSIELPNTITTLGNGCFNTCTSLTSIELPNTITTIGSSCFYMCTGLTSIQIPNNITILGFSSFNHCTGLTSIEIPRSVTTIKNDCFGGCTGLTSVVIPDTVTSMENACFDECYLEDIYFEWTSTDILQYNFYWFDETTRINVPIESISDYLAKGYPSEKLVKPEPTAIDLVSDNYVLSFYDSDSATLTATVTDDEDNPVRNVSVEFFSEGVSMGTSQTDTNGVATKTYNSEGVGDITFEAVCDVLSDSVTVEDCLYYQASSSTSPIVSSCTNNCIVEYEVYPSDTWNWHYVTVYDGNSGETMATLSTSYDNSSSSPIKTTYFPPKDSWTPMQVRIENSLVTISSNGTVKGTAQSVLDNIDNLRISNSKSTTTQRNVKIKPLHSVSLVASQSILSFADEDSAVLTATHSLGTGQTVNLYDGSDDSIIGTMTDNLDGTYSYTYNSQGIGDLEFYAKSGSLESETITIEDCLVANFNGTESFTSTGVVFKHLYSMPSEMDCVVEADIKSSNPVQFGLTLKESNNQTNNQYIRAGMEGSNKGSTITSSQYTHTTTLQTTASANVDFPVKIEYKNGVITGYVDNEVVETHNKTFNPLYVMLLAWGQSNRTVTVSNLKVKPLITLSLTSDVSVLSYADSDTCTLTATHSQGTGKTVQLYDASDDSLIGTMTDNNDGTYSYEYDSQGLGDLTVYAKSGDTVSSDLTIEDCIRIGFNGVTWDNNAGISQTDTSVTFTPNAGLRKSSTLFQADNWEATFTFRANGSCSIRGGLQSDSASATERSVCCYRNDRTNYNQFEYSRTNSETLQAIGKTNNNSYPYNVVVKLVANGNTINYYKNGTLVDTYSSFEWLQDNIHLMFHSWDNASSVTITDFKVKPL